MTDVRLTHLYERYIACLNARDWTALANFVAADVEHNARALGLSGYRKMLENNVEEIPDLHFNVDMLIVQSPRVASRLRFQCTPTASFLGLSINGKRVSFTENAFYEFREDKIARVWSVVDKAAIEAQL